MPEPEAAGQRDRIVKAAFGYRDALLAQAYAPLRDWPAAEDIVQDAFLVVMDKWRDCRGEGEVFPWVRRILQLKVLEALRARRGASSAEGEDPELLAMVDRAVEEHLDRKRAEEHGAMRRALQECMAGLDRLAVALLAGFYWRGRSCEALAAAHGKSPNAVRLLLSRVRARLRECVRRRLAGSEGGR